MSCLKAVRFGSRKKKGSKNIRSALNKIKGVFFDLFGTLMIMGDMEAEWSAWLSRFYECLIRYGLSMPMETFTTRCESYLQKDVVSGDEDGLTIFERQILNVCSGMGIDMKAASIKQTAETLLEVWNDFVSLDHECFPVLKELRRNKTLCLVSNYNHPPYVRKLIGELGLDEYFTKIIISGDYDFKKPDPAIFHLALEKTGLRADEVVHVGDSEEDIIGALAAGILPVLLKRKVIGGKIPDIIRKDSPITDVLTIHSLPELISLVEKEYLIQDRTGDSR